MAIKINDIPSEGLRIEINQKLDVSDTVAGSTDAQAVLNIKPASSGIFQIVGNAHAKPTLECSRCLKSYAFPIDVNFNFELAPLKSMGETPEHELVQGELDTEFYEGDEIDPIEIIREQLLIALPMVPLHHPDCKGLCSICGTDLNESRCNCDQGPGPAGPFSGLKDLLKK